MTKQIIVHCDSCGEKIEGGLSLFVYNDLLVDRNMQTAPIQKENHYCDKNCTEKIKEKIKEIKNGT